MNALQQRLLDVFEIEHREHSEAIRRIVSATGEPGEGEAKGFAEAMRRAHSLKGAARAVGLGEVETLAHGLESLFVKIQRGEAELDDDIRKHVGDTLDEIEDLISGPGETAADDEAPAGSDAAGGEEAGLDVRQRTDAAPAVSQHSAAPSEQIRVNAEDLDHLLKSAGELHTDMLFQNAGANEVRAVSNRLATLESRWVETWKEMEKCARDALPIPGRLLGNTAQATTQIRHLSRDMRAIAQRQTSGARSLRHHLSDLERRVVAARMVPAESVFGGFRKMVRDVAATEGKQVEVVIEGIDCHADRLVLQRIKDPVMHMLRNAVSHGIEQPQEREAAGKSPRGMVRFLISADNDRLHIVIEDDGRGIDFERIARKAREQNLVGHEENETLSEHFLCQLLFEPGFSTADSVTTISGRGVGLSVARETISDLQGSIDISAREGGGTRMEIALPVSILTRRLLLVTLREQAFALPCEAVARVMRVPASDIVTVEGRPMIRLKDRTLPLTSIAELLDLGGSIAAGEKSSVSIVVLRKGEAQYGVAVEGFVGVNDFVVRHFDIGSAKRRRWSGVITTEDGSPCLVLNADTLLASDLARKGSGFSFDVTQGDTKRVKSVLVVDDSITTRTLEKSILEAHGYRVRLSVDGRDALAQIRNELPDVVISDVEMPHMDGFELVRSIKSDDRLCDLPVILVTSRDDTSDRERGLMLGADAYVVKQRFDQQDLLETIGRMI
ncbi:MAG: response regulator [Nitratireductor sp.]|nr:response regulator [Nitratireductor sp.]